MKKKCLKKALYLSFYLLFRNVFIVLKPIYRTVFFRALINRFFFIVQNDKVHLLTSAELCLTLVPTSPVSNQKSVKR